MPFALATVHDRSEQDEPVLRGVPRVMKPYGSSQLYRTLIDLLGPDPGTLEPAQGSAGNSSGQGSLAEIATLPDGTLSSLCANPHSLVRTG